MVICSEHTYLCPAILSLILPKKDLRFLLLSEDSPEGMSRRGPLAGGALLGVLALLEGVVAVFDFIGVDVGVWDCAGVDFAGVECVATPDVTTGDS
jgi:hypothetical protein